MTLFWIIIGAISLALILEALWILVPVIFHLFVSPRFDGSYKYSREDFLADGFTPKALKLNRQENHYQFEFDQTVPEYRIRFGEDRCLAKGGVRVHTHGRWFASNPVTGEGRLQLKHIAGPLDSQSGIPGIRGSCQRVSVEWGLEGESITLLTHFDLYRDCTIEVVEPDLPVQLETIEGLNFILFKIELPDGLPNCATGSMERLSVSFPHFDNHSPNHRMLTFKDSIIAPPSRDAQLTSAPRLFFDDELNTFLVCPVDENLLHHTKVDQSHIACGLSGEVYQVEEGYASRTLLTFDQGINRTFERFGDLLREIHGTRRKSMYMDIALSHLGYWTDNGAYYYYNPMRGKTLSETLLEVHRHLREIGLPVRYFNIDSWWYQKNVSSFKRRLIGWFGRIIGGGLYGGALLYEPDPSQMHVPVGELSRLLEAPFVAHHRWFHADTPYKEQFHFYVNKNVYNFWNKLVRGFDDRSICIQREFWDMLMADSAQWQIQVWEQDWLLPQFKAIQALQTSTGLAEEWLVNMGQAARDHGVTILYALSSPGINLTSAKLEAVSSVRTAQDYHPRWPRSYDYKPFVQSNILAYALRLWPFKDVFRSTCEGIIHGEKMPEFMALVSTLSCGPVGVGDKIGKFGVDTIMRTCRRDGLILKPDKPLRAADRMYLPHDKYFLATTHSELNGKRWDYIVVNHLNLRQPRDKTITKEDIGIREDKVAYNYFRRVLHHLDDQNPFEEVIRRWGFEYWIAAPYQLEGFAVIGDISKFTTMSFKAFRSLEVDQEGLRLVIESIAGETIHLLMYDQDRITKIEVAGQPVEKTETEFLDDLPEPGERHKWYYDPGNGASLLLVNFDQDGQVEVSIRV